jgi:hypothetical protein
MCLINQLLARFSLQRASLMVCGRGVFRRRVQHASEPRCAVHDRRQ